jgi:hypothetical protein
MDIVTASVESQQVREPVLAAHDGGAPPPGRAMAVARRGRARRDKEMARANILNYLSTEETVWKVELRFVQLQNLSAALHLLYIFKAAAFK